MRYGIVLILSVVVSRVAFNESKYGNSMSKHKEYVMEKPFIVTVILDAKPGKEGDLKKALMTLIEPSREEPRCLEYHLHGDINNKARFLVYAKWASEEAHDEELQKPLVVRVLKKLDDLLAHPMQAIFLHEID
jgi:quinol monooxygenase YgiN